MALSAGVQVEGLREFQKGLKKLSPEIDKQLKVELKDVAEVVAIDARHRLRGRAGKSIRAGADAKGPYIKGGNKSIPWYGWQDFGSRTPKKGQPRKVGPWANSGKGPPKGRAIYPAIDDNQAVIIEGATKALNKARDAAEI